MLVFKKKKKKRNQSWGEKPKSNCFFYVNHMRRTLLYPQRQLEIRKGVWSIFAKHETF